MRTCIETAIAAGHISREQGEALNQRLDEMLREGLAPPEMRQRLMDDLAAEAAERKRRALLVEARRKVLTDAILSHKNARGENDPAEALWMILEHHGRANFIDVETKRQVILAAAHRDMEELLWTFRKGWLTGDARRRRNGWVKARLENVAKELHGQDTGDEAAKGMAKAFSAVAERLRQRFNAAGGNIGKLEDWGLPQSHSPEALMSAGRKAWVDFILPLLDRERMRDPLTGGRMDDVRLRETLEHAWERITSDGWIDREPSMRPAGRGALFRRHGHHRFLHFKDADAYGAYTKAFGAGDAYDAMVGHLSIMARDIAAMEVLGPNPEAMRNYLKALVLKQSATEKPVRIAIGETRARLQELVEKYGSKAANKGDFVARLAEVGTRMQDATRRLRRSGDKDIQAKNELFNLQEEFTSLQAQMRAMESADFAKQREVTQGRLREVKAKMWAIRDKSNPQLAGARTRRGKRMLAQLEAERVFLEDELVELGRQDGSIKARNPDALAEMERLANAMRGEVPFRATDKPHDAARKAIAWHDAMWEVMRGAHMSPTDSRWANRLQTARNILTAAYLGSAAVTATGDVAFQRAARRMVGLPQNTLRILRETVAMLPVAGAARRREAIISGLIMDSALHVLHQQARYIEGVDTKSWSGYFADRVIGVSGLSAWTQAGKHAFGMAIQAEYGKRVHLSFSELPAMMQEAFGRHGISAGDWDKMRMGALYEPRQGAAFLRPNEIAAGAGGEALAEKYLAMILRETRFAVPEGTAGSRSLTITNRPGTLAGEMLRNAGQFMSFGVAVIMLHGRRITTEFQMQGLSRGVAMTTGLAVSTAIAGAFVLQMQEIIKGRDPLPALDGSANSWRFWAAAMLKGGGLGIYGDIFFTPIDYGSAGIANVVAGPLGGTTERLRKRILGGAAYELGFKDKFDWKREFLRSASDVAPGSSLWYLRLVGNRLGLNALQLELDPNAPKVFQRMRQLQRRKRGNDYWWRPGESAPRRLPALFGKPADGVPPRSAAPPERRADGLRLLRETFQELMGQAQALGATERDRQRSQAYLERLMAGADG